MINRLLNTKYYDIHDTNGWWLFIYCLKFLRGLTKHLFLFLFSDLQLEKDSASIDLLSALGDEYLHSSQKYSSLVLSTSRKECNQAFFSIFFIEIFISNQAEIFLISCNDKDLLFISSLLDLFNNSEAWYQRFGTDSFSLFN